MLIMKLRLDDIVMLHCICNAVSNCKLIMIFLLFVTQPSYNKIVKLIRIRIFYMHYNFKFFSSFCISSIKFLF